MEEWRSEQAAKRAQLEAVQILIRQIDDKVLSQRRPQFTGKGSTGGRQIGAACNGPGRAGDRLNLQHGLPYPVEVRSCRGRSSAISNQGSFSRWNTWNRGSMEDGSSRAAI